MRVRGLSSRWIGPVMAAVRDGGCRRRRQIQANQTRDPAIRRIRQHMSSVISNIPCSRAGTPDQRNCSDRTVSHQPRDTVFVSSEALSKGKEDCASCQVASRPDAELSTLDKGRTTSHRPSGFFMVNR
jgi:hypothetical protein